MLTNLMRLNNRPITEEDKIHLRNAYKTMLDSNIISEVKLNDVLVRKFRGDFNGLLTNLGIPPIMWSTIIELNGMRSSVEFDGNASSIKIIASNDAESFLL